MPFARCGTLDRAVAQAAEDARVGRAEAVVLLSPACASYDQYPNFEVRGEHFRELVRALPGDRTLRWEPEAMVSRAERSPLGDWWWTVDRLLLAALAALMVAGLVFLMAGGPPVAERLGLSTFHFVNRQALFLVADDRDPDSSSRSCRLRHVRRLALLVYAVGMVLVLAGLPVRAGDQGRASLDHARRRSACSRPNS